MTEPAITARGFFERAGAGQLTALRCGACGELAIPPKELCPACHARDWQPVALAGEGTIASFTVIRVAPRAHARRRALRHRRRGAQGGRVDPRSRRRHPARQIAVGLPVRFRPLVVQGQTMVGFGPS